MLIIIDTNKHNEDQNRRLRRKITVALRDIGYFVEHENDAGIRFEFDDGWYEEQKDPDKGKV